MKFMDDHDVLQIACKSQKCWGIHFSFECSMEEALKAAPWLGAQNDGAVQALVDGCGFIFFDTETEVKEVFENTVGDDGPRYKNKYEGPGSVYVITCNPEGKLINENT